MGTRKREPPAKVKALTETNGRHKKHLERLEQVLRALNNETIQFEQVDAIKDDFIDYLVRPGACICSDLLASAWICLDLGSLCARPRRTSRHTYSAAVVPSATQQDQPASVCS